MTEVPYTFHMNQAKEPKKNKLQQKWLRTANDSRRLGLSNKGNKITNYESVTQSAGNQQELLLFYFYQCTGMPSALRVITRPVECEKGKKGRMKKMRQISRNKEREKKEKREKGK